MMAKLDHYSIEMELHHTQKLDAPSGTAISLAKGVIENSKYTAGP
jgi:4-hydroxy-tetrahydrodipicolinate reductase